MKNEGFRPSIYGLVITPKDEGFGFPWLFGLVISRPRRSCVFRCPWVVVLLPCLVIHRKFGTDVETTRSSGFLGWFQVSNDDWVVVSPYFCEFSPRSLRK